MTIQSNINQALSVAASLALRRKSQVEKTERAEIAKTREQQRAQEALKKAQDQKRASRMNFKEAIAPKLSLESYSKYYDKLSPEAQKEYAIASLNKSKYSNLSEATRKELLKQISPYERQKLRKSVESGEKI